MAKKIRIGIMGGGRILGAHAPGFTSEPECCEVVAVAEPRTELHGRIRSMFGSDKLAFYSDYTELLEKCELDAVDIVLPHDLHMPAAVAAAKAKKHVLCEKVMARNVYECNLMIEAAKENGVTLTIAHDRRYHPEWATLKRIADSGVLGKILFWKLEHNQDVLFAENDWVRYRSKIGGGAIMSCLTHQIDALRWYGGEVASVSAMTKVEPSRMEGECIGAVLANMENGALALLSINWFTQSHTAKNGLWYEFNHVTGTEGEAYFMSGKGTWLKTRGENKIFEYDLNTGGEFVRIPDENANSGHMNCISEWLRMLRGEESKVLTDGRDVLKTVEVAEAAYLSEKTGKTINLPIVPTPWAEN